MTFTRNVTPTIFIVLTVVISLLTGCAGGESPTSAGTADVPEVYDHKPSRDTIDWPALLGDDKPLEVPPTDLEWPGEKLGLTGPIVAIGGKGSDRYVLIYDPAGVLVGAMTQKEARADPDRLEQIILKAHNRGEHQNLHALQFMAALKIYTELTAAEGRMP